MVESKISCGERMTLPWPPSVNTYWRNWNGRMVIGGPGREYRSKIMQQCVAEQWGSFGPVKIKVQIVACPPDKRLRDLDNLFKAPLDALTKAGVWIDDSQIQELSIKWGNIEKGGKLYIDVQPC